MNKKFLYIAILCIISGVFFVFLNVENTEQKGGKQGFKKIEKSAIVNVYSSRREDLIKDLLDSFSEKYNIKVNYVIEDASKLISRMEGEGAKTQADLFITIDVINLILADEKGLLAEVDSKILEDAVPENLRSGHWFGLTKRARVIVYAKDRVKPHELEDYESLAEEKWRDRLLLRSSNCSYNQSLIASVIAADGEAKAKEWIKGMVRNMARTPYGGDIDQIKAVAAGEGDVTIVNSYYAARILTSENKTDKKIAERIGVFFPNQNNRGTMVNISGAGVTKYAKNRENAIALLEFMVSPDAQKIYAEKNQEYPVLASVPTSALLSSWGVYKTDKRPLKDLMPYMGIAIKIADEAGWK